MPPPKRRDSYKTTKSKGSSNEDSWRTEIENLTLNEDRWTCVIAMMVETRTEHARYVELFNDAAEEETREAIFSLSYEKLIRGTKLLAKSNPHQGICHFAGKQIEDEGQASMGPWLLCRLIKFFVHRAKTRYLEIRQSRARIAKEITEEIETLGATGSPNASAKSKGGSGDVRSFNKANTRLRKRGEEWRDRIHIDDAPIDGPNLYVVLSGFHDPNLPTELLNAGLPLTAIFKILRPEEDLDVDDRKLYTFWSSLEATLKNPETAFKYCPVVCQTFCPPELPESEFEALKTDAYRRVSFLMYDLCDIKRHHANYIGRMKLQPSLDETRPEIQVTETYDAIMSVIPEECASVPMILDALVCQIEGLKTVEETLDEVASRQTKSKISEDRLRSKIDYLNNEFDVFDVNRTENPPGNSEPRLIVHGDDFGSRNHHFSENLADILRKNAISTDFGVRVLREYATSLLWRKVPAPTFDQVEMHAYHIARISDCFDAKINRETTIHYLHLLLFDKMINGEILRTDNRERDDLEKKVSFPSLEELRLKFNDKNAKSQTIFSDKSLPERLPPSFCSDSVIEYGKEISETFECPELFNLIDTREMLEPDYPTSRKSFPDQNSGVLDLGDFDSVQLLSADVFSQVFFACSQQYDTFETRYFAPTDSMLILFHNNRASKNISEQQYAASIRTPVCLRDFSRFIMDEEKEWIDKEEELHGRTLVEKGALRKTETRNPDELAMTIRCTDADFILRDSIKGAEVWKEKSHQAPIDGTKTAKNRVKEAKETNTRKAKTPKIKDLVINPSHKREESLGSNASFKPLEDIASIHSAVAEEESSIFLGYNIANHRVQVSGFASEFLSEDGTSIKVNLEEWSYGEPGLQIIVKLLGNDFAVQSIARGDCLMFRFTTANGIVMGFPMLSKRKWSDFEPSLGSGQSITRGNYQGGKMGRESETSNGTWTPEMAVDPGFRVSWPSGLVVETLPGDGPSEPFYIKQSYLSKGPECSRISNETQRVYLRDGTIVVFLKDESVRLMRSNGCLVTCSGFAKNGNQQGKEEADDYSLGKRLLREQTIRKNETMIDSRLSGEAENPKNRQASEEIVETERKRKSLNSFTNESTILRPKDAVENHRNLRIIHTVVLDPDGRRYEIYNGGITRELGQELVRTASDYEVGEKFTRRGDGTNILIDSQGFLAISFPDGSRITTGYVIEKDPVFCEWTEEELRRFSLPRDGQYKSKENITKEDGFVSIFLTTCMEHKNYGTVTYDQSKIDCTLSMPGNVGIRISSDALISVTVGSATSLEVNRNEIVFTGRMGIPGSFSRSVYNLEYFSNSSIPKSQFLETTDSFGNVFSVDLDGKTSYKEFGIRSDLTKEDAERYSRLTTPGNNPSQSNSRSYRFFAVKRDLSAYEHLHRSERIAQENDQTASIFCHQSHDQQNQKLCTTLTTLNSITTSQAWLQSYRVPSIQPTNNERKDLLRSTYSIPWDYLIPYGKNGRGIWNRTWNQPLKNHRDSSPPEALLLLARTTRTIKNPDDDAVKKLQKALGCYWKKAINRFHEYRGFVTRRSFTPEEREIEVWVNDFVLGGRNTFDRALYFGGLVKSGAKKGLESRISKRMISGSEDKVSEEEIEWYKSCLRNRTVPPYFDDIPGACFLWVLECVNKIGAVE